MPHRSRKSGANRGRPGQYGRYTPPTRFRPRKPDTELSAECRQRLADVLRAHDNDDVNLDEFAVLLQDFGAWLLTRPEPERLEACIRIHEVATRHLTGRNLVAVGWLGLP